MSRPIPCAPVSAGPTAGAHAIDGVSGTGKTALARLAAARDSPFLSLWLDAPAETVLARVAQRRGDASDARRAVVRRQLSQSVGPVTWHQLDTNKPLDEVETAARGCLP